MKLYCTYCGKLVHTVRLDSRGNISDACRGKLVRTLGTGFKISSLTSNKNGLNTKITCKTCKPKIKTPKPIDFLTKALASTLNGTEKVDDDIDNTRSTDGGIFSEDAPSRTDTVKTLPSTESNETDADNAGCVPGVIPKPLDGLGFPSSMVEPIIQQRAAVRELIEYVPNLPNDRFMRHIVYNLHEQIEERNNILKGIQIPDDDEDNNRANNNPAPVAEPQGLARLNVENMPGIPDLPNNDNDDNMYEIVSARISYLDKQLKEIEDEYARLRKRITLSLMVTNKIDETVAAAIKFLGRDPPENT